MKWNELNFLRRAILACCLTLCGMASAQPIPERTGNDPSAAQLGATTASEPIAADKYELLPETPQPQQSLTAAVPPSTPPVTAFPLVNGQPYAKPTQRELTRYYLHTTFGPTGQAGVILQALYGQAIHTPSGWDENWRAFGQRFGSVEGMTFINNTVKFGLSDVFHEDFRYYRCPGCTWKAKINNVLLAEVTARHGTDGHRMFSITPIASHISGTVAAHELWFPDQNRNAGDAAGSVAAVLVIQVGIHVFEEFFLRHTEEKIPAKYDKYKKYLPGAIPPKPLTD